jgi:putative PIN family toxin of toxin-antitoxin system
MPREIVLDTNVLVAALRSKRGASHELVRSIGRADWRLNVSIALALEYEDVLKRSGMLEGISEAEIDDFPGYIFKTSNLVPFVLRQRPTLRDPDDERILEVAAECRAMIGNYILESSGAPNGARPPVARPFRSLTTRHVQACFMAVPEIDGKNAYDWSRVWK